MKTEPEIVPYFVSVELYQSSTGESWPWPYLAECQNSVFGTQNDFLKCHRNESGTRKFFGKNVPSAKRRGPDRAVPSVSPL